MSINLENKEYFYLPEPSTRSHMRPVDLAQTELDNKQIPHGVSPETYEFLIAARGYRAFKNIDPETIKLIEAYYSKEVSLRELSKSVGISRPTATNRILAGLNRAWEQLPDEIKLKYPKEEVIKLKNTSTISPKVSNKKSEAAKTLWGNKLYREKALTSLRQRKNNPEFIQRMREVNQGRPSPMQGKKRSEETTAKIRRSIQENWDKKHGIERTDNPSAKRAELFAEWHRIYLILGHFPSSGDITRLKNEDRTRFSITMYKQEFGQGSFTRATYVLAYIMKTPEDHRSRIMTLINPSYAQEFISYLKSNSKKLGEYGIPEEDVNRHSDQIKDACNKISLATSDEELDQTIERFELLISRIHRKISIMTPLSINKGRLRLQRDTP